MRKIRLLGQKDVPEYCELLLHAYTGFGLSEARKERMLREFRSMPDSDRNGLYGVFRDGGMTVGINELSSLFIGAVDTAALLDHGLMTLSDAARAPAVARLFRTGRPPLCRSDF